MIKKIGASLLTIVIAVGFNPGNVDAAQSKEQKKIQKTFKKLKGFPNAATPAGKVNNTTNKLFKLDPKKSSKYYKVAVKKYIVTEAEANAKKLSKDASKELKKSGLSEKEIAKIEKQIEDAPVPTPTPYQAWIGTREMITA
jgi:hypothetical protein